jgi:dipeptidase D
MIMGKNLSGIEPQIIWDNFEALCQVPRPSKKEEKVIEFIKGWALAHNFAIAQDKTGNLVVRKPATPGMENRKPICIQGHVDMVCEKNRDVEFDFDNDPIQPYIDGDWVKARGTTLGADNGIGVAMGMALMTDPSIKHPPIELLCTLDEETGLTGAITLATDILQCKILINLDSEEDGHFTIGCAGGINTSAVFKYEKDAVPAGNVAYEVGVKGGRGGHSGIEIHDGRANGAKFLSRLLYNLNKKFDLRLASFDSGNKHNAIPREGYSIVTIPAYQENDFVAYMNEFDKTIKNEFHTKEPDLTSVCAKKDLPAKVMTKDLQHRLIYSFHIMPHGVVRMSPDIKGLVQTSTNFAVIQTLENEITVLTSQRSSVESEKFAIAERVAAVLEFAGADVRMGDGYPAWEPNMNSVILNEAVAIYEKMYGKKPVIEAIHAGLECGLIGEKYPGMDMLSFGPNLEEVHTPNEKVQISSTQRTWNLLKEIVQNIPVNN